MQTVEELRLLHSITRSIVESKNFNSALEISLQKICESTGWTYGEVWTPSEDRTYLEYSKACYSSTKEMERFRIESEDFKFSHGVGLPGRVWSSKKPEWIDDVTINGKFPRQQLAVNSGLKSAVGIPVISDNDVIAVMIYLTSEILKEDEKIIEFISNIASQLGIFLNHKKIKEELLKTQKLEAIGILAGGIAHDFNNLLTAILGNVSLSKMKLKPDDKMYNWLTIAENACGQAKELSNRLITFATGGAPIRDTIPISELIRETVSELLSGTNIICECNFHDDIHPVKIDKTQIRQVIKNIIINAKEAMSEDGTIKIDANNIIITRDNLPLKEGNYVKITIEDSGKGIPQEIQSKIFDPYFTTKEMGNVKGRGLGLSICYSIIKQHNGLITVDSKVGAGTSIKIYLPTAK